MSSLLRALVVDDERLARVNLRSLLETQPGWSLVGECASGASAIEAIQLERPDVVFLDIRMPGLDGLQVAKLLAEMEPRPLVVFATAFEEHALEAFSVEAADYVLKPFDQMRFLVTLKRLERRLQGHLRSSPTDGGESWLNEAVEDVTTAATGHTGIPPQTLAVRSVGRVRLIAVADIHWIGAAGNYVRLYLADSCFLHRATLASLENELEADTFLRIHRSTMVNRRQVVELKTSIAGRYQLALRDGTELEISQRFKQRVFAALMPS